MDSEKVIQSDVYECNASKPITEHSDRISVNINNEQDQTNTQPFDSTAKAEEILEKANLNDFSQGNAYDNVMEMD